MTGKVSRNLIRATVIEGIGRAHELHKKYSRRTFVDAPEYFISVQIAERLVNRLKGVRIELEAPVQYVLGQAAGPDHPEIPKTLRSKGRFDLVAWWKAKKGPRAIIEVKHAVIGMSSLTKDIERICDALAWSGDDGPLQFGCVAYFCHAPKKEDRKDASKKLTDIENKIKQHAERIAKEFECVSKLEKGSVVIDVGEAKGRDTGKKRTRWGQAVCIYIRRLKK